MSELLHKKHRKKKSTKKLYLAQSTTQCMTLYSKQIPMKPQLTKKLYLPKPRPTLINKLVAVDLFHNLTPDNQMKSNLNLKQ